MAELPTDILKGIEKTARSRLNYLTKHKPVEGLLEINGLELTLKFLDDAKGKLERGEPITIEDMRLITESLGLAELGASINVRAIMDDAHR